MLIDLLQVKNKTTTKSENIEKDFKINKSILRKAFSFGLKEEGGGRGLPLHAFCKSNQPKRRQIFPLCRPFVQTQSISLPFIGRNS
jgi:hypothetical protein